MLYRMRRRDGSLDPFSSGTYVDSNGKSRHLSATNFQMTPSGTTWTSPVTNASYPIEWQTKVPSLNLRLQITTKLRNQEMTAAGSNATNYWEGAIEISGTRNDTPVSGVGYLEMTGYDKPLHFGQ
jgi:predicted secreted hydrolase